MLKIEINHNLFLLFEVFLLFRTVQQAIAQTPEWGYGENDGPKVWPNLFPNCGGLRQSPVDLAGAKTDWTYKPIKYIDYNKAFVNPTVTNNGHSAQISGLNVKAKIKNGPLNSTYEFLQFHFHWGAVDTRGSEHTIKGTVYPIELHIVHKNQLYSAAEAPTKPDGLAVLGILLTLSRNDNPDLKHLINALPKIIKYHQVANISGQLSLDCFIPKASPYYTYMGSLTTPTCNEAVVWVVFRDHIKISRRQLNAFRRLNYEDGSPMVDNFRPVQQLNDRKIYLYKKVY